MRKGLGRTMKQPRATPDRPGWALKRRYQRLGTFLALALLTLLWVTTASVFVTRAETGAATPPANPAATLLDNGRIAYEKGEYEAARQFWEDAGKVYTQQGDRAGIIQSQLNQAQALKAQGAYPRAETILLDTLQNDRLAPPPDSREAGLLLRSLGDVYQAIGKLDCPAPEASVSSASPATPAPSASPAPPASESSPAPPSPSPAAVSSAAAPCTSPDNARTALERSLEIAQAYPDDRSAVYLSLGLVDRAKFSRIPPTAFEITEYAELLALLPDAKIPAAIASQTAIVQSALDNFRQARQTATTPTAAAQADLNQLSLLVNAIPHYNRLLTAALSLPKLKEELLGKANYVQRCFNASSPLPLTGAALDCKTYSVAPRIRDLGQLIRSTAALTAELLQVLSQVQPDVQRLRGDRAAIAARLNYAQSLTQLQSVADSAAAVNQPLIALLSKLYDHKQPSPPLPAQRSLVVSLFLPQATHQQLQQAVQRSSTDAATALQQAIIAAQALGHRQLEATARIALGELYAHTATTKQDWEAIATQAQAALGLVQDQGAAAITYRAQWLLAQTFREQGSTRAARAACQVGAETLRSLRSDLVSIDQDMQFTFRDRVAPFYRECAAILLPNDDEQQDLTKDSVQANLEAARNMIESLQLAELDNYLREACIQGRKVPIDTLVEEHPQTAFIYPIILPHQQVGVIARIPQAPGQQKALGDRATKPSDPLLYHAQTLSGKDSVETILSTLQKKLANGGEVIKISEIQALSQKVYRWVIAPFAEQLQQNHIKTLVFVLDGAFRSVPMSVLHDGEAYLVEKYAIAISPGLQLLAPPAIAQTKALKLLAAGLSKKETMPKPFDELPGVEAEFKRMEDLGIITTPQLFEETFTATALRDLINTKPFNVVHLATHGEFSSQQGGTYIVTHDGRLPIDQLGAILSSRDRKLPEPIDLLVLSACETATGDDRAALGLAGIALKSGARSTLASLWKVADEVSPALIEQFYTALQAKKSKAEALQLAQIEILKTEKNPNRWAPYVLVGNWL